MVNPALEILTESNFLLYCAKHYNNPQLISTEEFLEDLDRLKYIKKLITRYVDTSDLKERLILNHIIALNNCFDIHTVKILYLKMSGQFEYLKPFLVFLNILPSKIYGVSTDKIIHTDDIKMDSGVIEKLRKLDRESRRI